MESHHLTAIDMLARGLPADYIAKKLNVNDRTLRRWKIMPEFAEELRLAVEMHRFTLRVRHDQIEGKCQTFADEGLEKIAHVMRTDPDPRVCLRAANTLLTQCTRMSARSAALEKADKNGRDVQLEKAPEKRTSAADSENQPQSAKPLTRPEPMSAPGHSAEDTGVGAKEQTAVSFAPCCEDTAPQKMDANGQESHGATGASTAPILKDGSIHPCPDDHPTQKADENGHDPVGAKEQTAVPFAPCCEAPATRSANANEHRASEKKASSATIKPPQQGGTGDTAPGSSLAPSKSTPKADESGHDPELDNQPPENWEMLDEDPDANISHEEFIARLTPEDIAQMRVQIGLPSARKVFGHKPDYRNMTAEEAESERKILEFQHMLNRVLFPELAAEFPEIFKVGPAQA